MMASNSCLPLSSCEDELKQWMFLFKDELDDQTFALIYGTLHANHFTSRLKIKLIGEDQIGLMFAKELSLGTKALLKYQIQLLRDESPLVTKAKPRVAEPTSKEKPAKKNVLKALECEERKLKNEIEKAKDDLQELDINIESMDIQVKEPPHLGNSKTICGNCHHRGHRNQSSKACKYDKCTDYTYCGIREKHPEFFSKLNSLKLERKKKKDTITELENQVKSMQQFSSSSEHQFIKNLTPRLYKVDENYKKNKPKLMRDVRLIREHLGGKIPPESANDVEQLKLLIRKCQKNRSIQDYQEDSVSDSGQSVSDSSTSSDSSLEYRKRKKHKKKSKSKKKKSRRKKSSTNPELRTGVSSFDSGNSYPYMNYNPFSGYVMGNRNPGVNNNPYQFPNQPVQIPTAMYQHYMTPPFSQHIPAYCTTQTSIHQVSLGQGSPSKSKIESPNSYSYGNLDALAAAADIVKEEK